MKKEIKSNLIFILLMFAFVIEFFIIGNILTFYDALQITGATISVILLSLMFLRFINTYNKKDKEDETIQG